MFNKNRDCGCCRPLQNFGLGMQFNNIGLTNISGSFFANKIAKPCCGCLPSVNPCGTCNTCSTNTFSSCGCSSCRKW